jgi:homocitrate synthase NifV
MNNSQRTIELIDTTLRDGAQSPHISLSLNDKIAIVSILYKAGIRTFEAGIPAMGPEERNDLVELKKLFPQCTFIGWCRANKEDINHAFSCGCDCVHISFPVSSLHMDIVRFTKSSVLDYMQQLMEFSLQNAHSVSIGAQDASRAELSFLKIFTKTALETGAQRVRIADTVGILSPLKTKVLFESLLETVPGKALEFHGHNDFGMATANTVTALETGVDYASVTVNGIGERAGNAALEEVVMALIETTSLLYTFNTSLITSMCATVANVTNTSIPENKPVSGKSVFLHKSGIHCHGQNRNRKAYEAYDPQITGHSPSRYCIGTHSGISGIKHILGVDADSVPVETLRLFLETIQQLARLQKRSLSETEVRTLFEESIGK